MPQPPLAPLALLSDWIWRMGDMKMYPKRVVDTDIISIPYSIPLETQFGCLTFP